MTILARIVRYIFWVLVVSWSVAILRGIVNRMGRGVQQSHPSDDVADQTAARKLVRDPVCGMHIAEGLALPLRQDGEILHFCSAECRDKYMSGTQRFAANA
jgi:YHS domain-containing protein